MAVPSLKTTVRTHSPLGSSLTNSATMVRAGLTGRPVSGLHGGGMVPLRLAGTVRTASASGLTTGGAGATVGAGGLSLASAAAMAARSLPASLKKWAPRILSSLARATREARTAALDSARLDSASRTLSAPGPLWADGVG